MKKLCYLIVVFTMFTTSSFAQIEKGGQLVGVQSLFVKSFPKDDAYISKSYNTDFSLFHLFMVSNRIGLGYFTNLNFAGSTSEGQVSWGDNVTYKNRNLTGHIGPILRYSIPISEKTYIFPQFMTGLGINRSKYETEQFGSSYTNKSSGRSSLTEIQIGMSNFLSQRVALETKVGYGWATVNQNDQKTKINALGASFGAVLYFNKKVKI